MFLSSSLAFLGNVGQNGRGLLTGALSNSGEQLVLEGGLFLYRDRQGQSSLKPRFKGASGTGIDSWLANYPCSGFVAGSARPEGHCSRCRTNNVNEKAV